MKEDDDNDVTSDTEMIVKTQRCVVLRNDESVNMTELGSLSKGNDGNETDDAWLTRIDPCCLSECESRATEDCVTMKTDVGQYGVDAVSAKLAKLEHVFVMIGYSQLNCRGTKV